MSVALRPEDVKTLQLLALVRHATASVAAIEAAGEATTFRGPENPSVSYAIRCLIDEERARSIARWRELASRGHGLPWAPDITASEAKKLTDEQLLARDPVFGHAVQSSDPAAVDALVPIDRQPARPKPAGKRKGR